MFLTCYDLILSDRSRNGKYERAEMNMGLSTYFSLVENATYSAVCCYRGLNKLVVGALFFFSSCFSAAAAAFIVVVVRRRRNSAMICKCLYPALDGSDGLRVVRYCTNI